MSQTPLSKVQLKECISDSIRTVERIRCARPNTFELRTMRPRRHGDRDNLISQDTGSVITTKCAVLWSLCLFFKRCASAAFSETVERTKLHNQGQKWSTTWKSLFHIWSHLSLWNACAQECLVKLSNLKQCCHLVFVQCCRESCERCLLDQEPFNDFKEIIFTLVCSSVDQNASGTHWFLLRIITNPQRPGAKARRAHGWT